MTNFTRLQESEHKLNQLSRQHDARNVSDALKYSLQRAACPVAGQTLGLVPQTKVSKLCWQHLPITWPAPVSLLFCSPVLPVPSHHCSNCKRKQRCTGPRVSNYCLSIKQGQQFKKPLPGCNSLLQLADTVATLMLQPGLATLAVAIYLLHVGLAKSGCPTHCMKCKRLKDDCLCLRGTHPQHCKECRKLDSACACTAVLQQLKTSNPNVFLLTGRIASKQTQCAACKLLCRSRPVYMETVDCFLSIACVQLMQCRHLYGAADCSQACVPNNNA